LFLSADAVYSGPIVFPEFHFSMQMGASFDAFGDEHILADPDLSRLYFIQRVYFVPSSLHVLPQRDPLLGGGSESDAFLVRLL
jgi:hypothetical protein